MVGIYTADLQPCKELISPKKFEGIVICTATFFIPIALHPQQTLHVDHPLHHQFSVPWPIEFWQRVPKFPSLETTRLWLSHQKTKFPLYSVNLWGHIVVWIVPIFPMYYLLPNMLSQSSTQLTTEQYSNSISVLTVRSDIWLSAVRGYTYMVTFLL